MKNVVIFIFGGIFGSIVVTMLAISGVVNLVTENDVSISFDLSREDIARIAEETRAPSVEGIQLSTKVEQTLFRCPAATSESCKVEYKFSKKD
jgi:hypothetical protein